MVILYTQVIVCRISTSMALVSKLPLTCKFDAIQHLHAHVHLNSVPGNLCP